MNTWEKYEKGKDYLNKKSLVNNTNRNWNFYMGDQWNGLKSGKEELPIFNFITPVIKYKVATVAQNRMVAQYTDMDERPEYVPVCQALSRNFIRLWEKDKLDIKGWKNTKFSAIEGDSYIYWGSFDMADGQVLHTTQIMFGDEQNDNIQEQPYIILHGRQSVKALQEEAEANGVAESEWKNIKADEETTNEIGNKEEVKGDGKCTYIIYLDRNEQGIVCTEKRTEHCVISEYRALENKDFYGNVVSGLTLYPIVSMIWENQPNNARGRSEVARLIPNQLEANKTLARRSMTVKMTAYPRLAYDANAIQNPEDLERVGAAIGLNGAAGNVDTMIKYLNPASMSHDAESLLNDLVATTKELAGAGDMALGNVSPERASGAAITAVRDQNALPLNEQIAAYNQYVEDIARLSHEMMMVANPNGLTLEDGQFIDGEMLRDLKLSVKVDVSADNGWTKYAEQQELLNLLTGGFIDFNTYLEALPDGGALPKNKLKTLTGGANDGNLQMQDLRSGISEATSEGQLPSTL